MPSDRAYEKARCPQGERIDAKLKETLHNAFYDRRFKPKGNFMKINYFEDTDTALIEFTSYTAKKQIPISPPPGFHRGKT